MPVLMLQHVSSRVPGFPVASPCLWGKLQNLSCVKVSWFCVTDVAIRDILTCMCLQTCRNSLCVAQYFRDVLRRWGEFSWQAWHFGDLLSLRGKRSTRDVSCLCESRCQGCMKWWQRAIPWQACDVMTCDDAPHSTLYILQSTLYSLHSTLHTLHSAFHTPHFTLHTLHFTPKLYILYFTLYMRHFTLHTLHATLPTWHFELQTRHFTLHTLHSTPYTLHTFHFALHTLHFTLGTLHFTLQTLHPTLFRIPPSTVHWYSNRGKKYKTVQIPCFTKLFYVTAFGFVGYILFFLQRKLFKRLRLTQNCWWNSMISLIYEQTHMPIYTLWFIHYSWVNPRLI